MSSLRRASKKVWRLEKLEKRILLSADIPLDVLQESQGQDPEVEAAEVVQVGEQDSLSVTSFEDYQPILAEPLVDVVEIDDRLDPDTVFTNNEQLVVAQATDLHITPQTVFTAEEPLVVDGDEVLSGSGTVIGDVIVQSKVSPGNSPGVLNIQGDFSQEASGVTWIELGGTGPGTGYD